MSRPPIKLAILFAFLAVLCCAVAFIGAGLLGGHFEGDLIHGVSRRVIITAFWIVLSLITILAGYAAVTQFQQFRRYSANLCPTADMTCAPAKIDARSAGAWYNLPIPNEGMDMTLAQVNKRLTRLEQTVGRLVHELDYRQSVEAIREGLQSADRGEGRPASRVFARLRRKYKLPKSR